MHPITIIELTIAAVIALAVCLAAGLLLPANKKKLGHIAIAGVLLLEIGFFAVRTVWVNHQAAVKMEQLEAYLQSGYPGEQWTIQRREGRQYSPYQLEVEFGNEPGWIYTYYVKDEASVMQIGIAVPGGQSPDDGRHIEVGRLTEDSSTKKP